MMNRTIRHLEHHFHANGRLFVVHIFNKDEPSSRLFREIPKQKAKIDVSIYSYHSADFENMDPTNLYEMSSSIVGRIKSCLPSSISPTQWNQFESVVSAWICSHRRLPLRTAQEGWMKKLGRRIGLTSPKTSYKCRHTQHF